MLESVYKTCLEYRLRKRGLSVEIETPVLVFLEEVKMECSAHQLIAGLLC